MSESTKDLLVLIGFVLFAFAIGFTIGSIQ